MSSTQDRRRYWFGLAPRYRCPSDSSSQIQSKVSPWNFSRPDKYVFESDDGCATRDVLNLDRVQQVGNATRRHQFTDCIFRDSAGANTARSSNQNTLHCIAYNFARDTEGPAVCRSIKAFAFPRIGITPRCVYGGLEAASQRLANLVSRHEQALAMCGAGGMKLRLFRVTTVVAETVLSEPSLPLCLQG